MKKYIFQINKFYSRKALFWFYFFILNIVIFLIRYMVNFDWLLELYFLLQFLFLNFLWVYLFGRFKVLTIISLFIGDFLYIITCAFYFFSGNRADFNYIARNSGHMFFILWERREILVFTFILAIVYAYFSYKVWPRFKTRLLPAGIMIAVAMLIISQPPKYNNELIYFIKSVYRRDAVLDSYNSKYQELLRADSQQRQSLQIQGTNQDSYLNNIIILHLESINAFEVTPKHTPNLLNIAQQGVYFKNFYSNSIQTMGAYENIFCSLPSSFKKNLVQTKWSDKVGCLPHILKQAGYQTMIFKGGVRLAASGTDTFEKNIGFVEAHNSDIMSGYVPESWGYKEDEFYTQTFKYLKEHQTSQPKFIYIDVGTTNHYPFVVPAEDANLVPYPQPHSVYERVANTTFLQDRYLELAWQKINELYPQKNFTLLILSDSGWPVGLESKNTFNESGGYEENFRIPLVAIFGGQEQYKNIVIENRYSQMDIMPSILDLLGIDWPGHIFAKSFMSEIKGQKSDRKRNIVLVQPYSQRLLNIVNEAGIKYQYNSEESSLFEYDLNLDPMERSPRLLNQNKKEIINFLNKLLN